MFTIEKKILDVIIQRIRTLLEDELIAIIAYGSRVRGDFHDTSDFDILIIVKKKSFALLNMINQIITEEETNSLNNFGVVVKGLNMFNQEKNSTLHFIKILKMKGKCSMVELSKEEKISLSDIRFEKSKTMLTDAKKSFETEMYKTSVNRSYYAVLHAARSLLILQGVDPLRHEGVKTMLLLHFVKSKLLS